MKEDRCPLSVLEDGREGQSGDAFMCLRSGEAVMSMDQCSMDQALIQSKDFQTITNHIKPLQWVAYAPQ